MLGACDAQRPKVCRRLEPPEFSGSATVLGAGATTEPLREVPVELPVLRRMSEAFLGVMGVPPVKYHLFEWDVP